MRSTPPTAWCRSPAAAAVLVLVLDAVVAAPAVANARHNTIAGVEVPVECGPAREDADAVLCRVVGAEGSREGRRLLGRIGFLTGLHLGGAISSSGSLSASHSLNVFGKVMNTALSVSYGPNGYYQAPGAVGGRPPLSPIGPGFGGLADDPNAPAPPASASSTSTSSSSSTSVSSAASASPDKGAEASAVLSGTIARDTAKTTGPPGNARVELEQAPSSRPQNRLPVAEDIVAVDVVGDKKVAVDAPGGTASREEAEPAPVHEDADEDEAVGEEPEPPAAPAAGLQLSSERRAQLEAVARVRTPSADDQRRLFLQHHNQHVAAFNRHYAKYSGDVSRVAVFSRTV